jgi:hypothetical protein
MILDEVKLRVNVFGLLTRHFVLRICIGARVEFPGGGGLVEWLEDLPN